MPFLSKGLLIQKWMMTVINFDTPDDRLNNLKNQSIKPTKDLEVCKYFKIWFGIKSPQNDTKVVSLTELPTFKLASDAALLLKLNIAALKRIEKAVLLISLQHFLKNYSIF